MLGLKLIPISKWGPSSAVLKNMYLILGMAQPMKGDVTM